MALLLTLLSLVVILLVTLVAHEYVLTRLQPMHFPLINGFGDGIVKTLFPDVAADRERRMTVQREIPEIRTLLHSDPESAERRILQLQIHQRKPAATAGTAEQRLSLLIEDLQQLKELTARRRTVLSELNRQAAETRALLTVVAELHQRLSQKLGILGNPPTVNIEALQFYQSGLLAGLPRIDGIPDGITTIGSLMESARRLGATQRITTEREYDEFQEALEELRTAASALPKRSDGIAIGQQQLLTERNLIADQMKSQLAITEQRLQEWISGFPENTPIWNALSRQSPQSK